MSGRTRKRRTGSRWIRSLRTGPRRRGSWHRAVRVHWWLRLAGWLALAGAFAAVFTWWAAPLGVPAFELILAALVLRRIPVTPDGGWGGGGPGEGGGAGVREPRRPLPTSGAGAAAIPG